MTTCVKPEGEEQSPDCLEGRRVCWGEGVEKSPLLDRAGLITYLKARQNCLDMRWDIATGESSIHGTSIPCGYQFVSWLFHVQFSSLLSASESSRGGPCTHREI